MANLRFYLPSSGAPDFTPDYSAKWLHTDQADRVRMSLAPSGTSMAYKSVSFNVTSPQAILIRQYVSPPLPAMPAHATFCAGLVRGYLDAAATITTSYIFRLFSASGTLKSVVTNTGFGLAATALAQPKNTPQGAIDPYVNGPDLSPQPGSTVAPLQMHIRDEWLRLWPSDPMVGSTQLYEQTVIVASGDRFVLEIGASALSGSPIARTLYVEFGDSRSGDLLKVASGTPAPGNPWVDLVDVHNPAGSKSVPRFLKPLAPTLAALKIVPTLPAPDLSSTPGEAVSGLSTPGE